MAEAFNDHFTNIGQVLAQEVPAAEVNPEFYLSHTDKAFYLKTPSLDVVFKLLRNIDEKKATGLDMIPSKLLKMAASIVTPSLTAIFTKSIITGIYPTEWKMARVTPVFKKGEKSDLNNYRPISVIPVVSKVFEKIVYDQLYQYLNDNQLLSSCQSGFRSLHSTLTAFLEATNSWSVNIDNGFLNGVVFIDLKKAFGTIDHEGRQAEPHTHIREQKETHELIFSCVSWLAVLLVGAYARRRRRRRWSRATWRPCSSS